MDIRRYSDVIAIDRGEGGGINKALKLKQKVDIDIHQGVVRIFKRL